MFIATVDANKRIEGRHNSSGTERRLHETGSARTCAACTARRAACTCAGSARSESADAAAWGPLHYAGVDTAKEPARLGAQNIRIGDWQVVSGDRQIEVVLERKVNRVCQGEIELAVPHKPVEARRVRKNRLRYRFGHIRIQGIECVYARIGTGAGSYELCAPRPACAGRQVLSLPDRRD